MSENHITEQRADAVARLSAERDAARELARRYWLTLSLIRGALMKPDRTAQEADIVKVIDEALGASDEPA